MELTLADKTVRYANGGRDHDPALPAVVLIHGSGMNRTVWQSQTRFLAHHGYRVAAVDLPGHGGSEGPCLESMAEIADWIAEVIDALDLGPAHLVGHSMGSYIALEAAARHPDSVRSLVLIGTAESMPVHPDLLTSSFSDVPHASRLMASWGFSSRAHIGRHPTPGMWNIGGSTALVDVSRGDSLGVDMAACDAYDGALDAAEVVRCPVSFVLGSADKMTPNRRVGGLQAAMPQAHTVVLDGVGHMIPIEAPDETRDAIVEALSRAALAS